MPKVKEVRLKCGLEQTELAAKIGTNAPMLSNFENYKCLPVPAMPDKEKRQTSPLMSLQADL